MKSDLKYLITNVRNGLVFVKDYVLLALHLTKFAFLFFNLIGVSFLIVNKTVFADCSLSQLFYGEFLFGLLLFVLCTVVAVPLLCLLVDDE